MDAIATKTAAGFASDAVVQRLTSIQRTRRLFAAAAICALVAVAALAIDLPLWQWLKQHPLRGEIARIVRLSEVVAWGGTVWLIVLTAGVLDIRGWRIALPLAASSLGAGIIADAIKLGIGRWRPSAAAEVAGVQDTFAGWLPMFQPGLGEMRRYVFQSFPSAHAATAAGLAAALGTFYPRGQWLFASFAALALLQRVEAQAHWCSDVFAGAALGIAIAAVVIKVKSLESLTPDS
jgi:membrane-associated phospholipid phosphatase